MKIAQIAPLYESVPPKLYGGTERIVSYLTEELVARNHDVTLFASADSVTRARLVPASESALRLSPTPVVDTVAHYIRLLELVFREAHQFDVLHFHIDYLHFPFTKRQPVPAVTTLHGNLSIPDLVPLYKEFREMNVVSISDAQRQPLPSPATVIRIRQRSIGLNCDYQKAGGRSRHRAAKRHTRRPDAEYRFPKVPTTVRA